MKQAMPEIIIETQRKNDYKLQIVSFLQKINE